MAICLLTAFYYTADLGVSVYDAIVLIITNKWNVNKIQYNRIINDSICVGMGIFLLWIGTRSIKIILENVWVGTIAGMLFMGPFINWFKVHISDPMLKQ